MSEHNIFQEIDEDMERQRLEALWKRFGGLIMAVALVAIIVTGVVSFWHKHRDSRDQTATGALVKLENAENVDAKKRVDDLKAFADSNAGSAQAVFAALHAAGLAAYQGDKDRALQIYSDISKDRSADTAFRQFADLQAIRIQLDNGDPAQLSTQLQPLAEAKAPWRFSAMEYQGYLAIKLGDKAKARAIFSELAQNAAVPHDLAQRATDMLHYVSE